LDDLAGMLLHEFAGRTLTMQKVYEEHNVGTPYIKPHYKGVLRQLEQAGKITADPPESERRRDTFADDVRVTFPKRKRRGA
jgi:hypothetical protein